MRRGFLLLLLLALVLLLAQPAAGLLYQTDYVGISVANPTGGFLTEDAQVSSTGLVLALDMETLQSSGVLRDFSGLGNDATITVGTVDVAGRFGRARDFDSVDDQIQVTDDASLKPNVFTIGGWVYLKSGGNNHFDSTPLTKDFAILHLGFVNSATPVQQWGLKRIGETKVVQLADITASLDTSLFSSFSYDGRFMTAYLDGVQSDLHDFGSVVNPDWNTTAIFVGANNFGGFDFSIIGEVLMWNRVLSAAEHLALATGGTQTAELDTALTRYGYWGVERPPISADGLVLAYDMERLDASGDMLDYSSRGNAGVLTGTTDVEGQFGRARSFSASTDVIKSPLTTSVVDDFSISVWAYFDGTSCVPTRVLVYNGDSGLNGWGLVCNSASNFISILRGGLLVTDTTATYPVNAWTNVVLNRDAGTWNVYQDGSSVFSSAIGAPNGPTTETAVGGGVAAGNVWPGRLDEPLILTRVLSPTEVTQNFEDGITARSFNQVGAYDSGLPFDPTGLVLSYNMENTLPDATDVSEMRDFSGRENHGVITGTTDVAGLFGRARNFDASNDYVEAVHDASLVVTSSFTLSIWANVDDTAATRGLISKTTSNLPAPFDTHFNLAGDTVFLIGNGSSFQQIESGGLQLGVRQHWAFRYDGSVVSIFLGGFIVAGPTTVVATVGDNGDNVRIGTRNDLITNMIGELDEPLIFSRPLSDSEILSLSTPGQRQFTETQWFWESTPTGTTSVDVSSSTSTTFNGFGTFGEDIGAASGIEVDSDSSFILMLVDQFTPDDTDLGAIWRAEGLVFNPTTFTLQGFDPGSAYRMVIDGVSFGDLDVDAEGTMSFTYDRSWSLHRFVLVKIGTGGRPPPGPAFFTLAIGYALLDQSTVRLQAETDCEPNCSYRWDMGDGTVLEGQAIVHRYVPAGLWGFYPVELQVCTFDGVICETRVRSVLIVNWLVLLALVGGLLAATIILGSNRVRGRILRAVRR